MLDLTDKDPDEIYKIYKEVGRNKDHLIEVLLNPDAIPVSARVENGVLANGRGLLDEGGLFGEEDA